MLRKRRGRTSSHASNQVNNILQSSSFLHRDPKERLHSKQICSLSFILSFILLSCIFIWPVVYTATARNKRGHIRIVDDIQRDNCGCFPHDGTGARVAYFVTFHNQRTLDDSVVLVRNLAAASNIILIHIDEKLPLESYETSNLKEFIHGECKACEATVVVKRKYNVKWGEWSMNEPTHWSMMELVTNPKFVDQWDVYINLSSDSLPVYTPQVLSNLFQSRKGTNGSGRTDETLRGYNFVTSSSCITGLAPTNINMFPPMWHKRKHYEHLGDFNISFMDNYGEQKTEQLIIHFGSQWMILTPDFVRYLVTSLQDKDSLASQFKAELIARRVLMTDETFIPTLIANHPSFRQTIPVVERDGALRIKSSEKLTFSIKSVRYERMDENLPDAFGHVVHDQRYQVPDYAIHVDIPREWGPYYLGTYDLGNIKDSGALFIRKVSRTIDPNLHHLLPVSKPEQIPTIRWPSEVKVSGKVNWEPILEYTKHIRGQ